MQRAPRSVDAIVEQQVQKWLQERKAAPPARVKAGSRLGAHDARHEIARGGQGSERVVAALDEHHRASVVETVRSMMRMGPLSASEYFHELARLVHSIAAHGSAVLVGRG